MKFKAPGNAPISLGLTSGHMAIVEPTGTDLQPMFHAVAIARGCIPEGVEIPKEEPTAPNFDRAKVIADAMRKMLESTDDGMFTAQGKPDKRKLDGVCGFQTSREEVDAIWSAVKAEAA